MAKPVTIECQLHSECFVDSSAGEGCYAGAAADLYAFRAIELYDTMTDQEREGFKSYLRNRIARAL